jgi:molecular chaperone GrpE (heat shock protein)
MRLGNIGKRRPKEFAITEKQIPLHALETEDGADLIAIIEDDIRKLMRQRAELELALTEKEHEHTNQMQKFLLRIIEVLDSFEQLFDNIGTKKDQADHQTKIWIGNFRTIYRFLKSIIEEQDVIEIELLDWTFDPQWHRVIETVVEPSKPDGTIVRQVQKGYLWPTAAQG